MTETNFEGMKCVTCGIVCDHDDTNQCLHCWCISHNLECQCGCIEDGGLDQ